MKSNIRLLTAIALVATLGVAAAQAEITTKDTGRGERQAVIGNPPNGPEYTPASTHQGPLVGKRVTRQHIVDPKKRILHEQAAIEQTMPQCHYVLKRDGSSHQTHTVMVHHD